MNRTMGATAIGPVLRRARKAKRLSLRDLATRVKVSPSLLSQIENSKANPSVATLYAIAAALSLPPSHFFQDLSEANVGTTDGPGPAVEIPRPEGSRATLSLSPATVEKAMSARPPLVRSIERVSIELLGGVTWFRLTPGDEANVEFLEIVYDVGATSGEKLSRHSGREYGLLLEGQLRVELGFERYILSRGDSIAFDSSTPHRLANIGNVPARAVWVVVRH